MTRSVLAVLLVVIMLLAVGKVGGQDEESGCAVLFDNSGSMRQYFDEDLQIADAKQLVLDLMFKGIYDETKWDLTSGGEELRPLWESGIFMYVHPFGELDGGSYPYFKMLPVYDELASEVEARRFVQTKLYDRLDLNDNKTNIQLALRLSWFQISNLFNEEGRDLFMDVIQVTDDQPDIDTAYPGVGLRIEQEMVRNQVGITPKHLFLHKKESSRYPGTKLLVRHLRVGPHFILPQADESRADTIVSRPTDYVRITQPRRNTIFGVEDKTIGFTWDSQGDFEKYVLEISQQRPKRKILEVSTVGGHRLTVDIERQILKGLQNIETKDAVLTAVVTGVYPRAGVELLPVTSERVAFKIATARGAVSRLWLLLIVLAATAGYFLYRTGAWDRLRESLKGSETAARPQKQEPDEDDW